jgi:fimbrial chaperone protein
VEGIGVSNGKLQVGIRNTGNRHALIPSFKISGLDAGGAEVFTKDIAGWYVLPGAVRRFALDLTAEECGRIKVLKTAVAAGDARLETTLDIDETVCAQLTTGDESRKAENQ